MSYIIFALGGAMLGLASNNSMSRLAISILGGCIIVVGSHMAALEVVQKKVCKNKPNCEKRMIVEVKDSFLPEISFEEINSSEWYSLTF